MEIVACRFWTRVTRPRTILPTVGNVLNFMGMRLFVEPIRLRPPSIDGCEVLEGFVDGTGKRDTVSILFFLPLGSLLWFRSTTGPGIDA